MYFKGLESDSGSFRGVRPETGATGALIHPEDAELVDHCWRSYARLWEFKNKF